MKPIYSSNPNKCKRPRKSVRPIGMMPRTLKADVERYGISKLALGMTLINLGINVINLNIR